MKINPLQDIVASAATAVAPQTATKGVEAAAQKAELTTSAGVPVTVSNSARTLEVSSQSITSGVDMQKVNQMRDAIASGTFKVNPEAIADKLLSNAQELLSRVRA